MTLREWLRYKWAMWSLGTVPKATLLKVDSHDPFNYV